jgi:predicted transposase YdaD
LKNEEKIIKYIDSISFLAGLFDIEIRAKPMPIQVDIRKTFLYKWGKEEGLKEGEQKGIIKGLKEGEKRGIVKGLKEAILVGTRLRFGDQKAKQIRNFLEKIDDLNHLKKIKREVIRAENWENFVKSIKNSNSKNKI